MPELNPIAGDYTNLTRPIVDVWKGLINRARHVKQRFNDRADQVMSFYSGGPGAMWRPDYMNRFMGGPQAIQAPRFKITLNLAFEQVAILRPLLYWEQANRSVKPHRTMQLDPQVLAGGNPQALQYFEQLAQQQANQDQRNVQRAQVLEHMLNYFQREQPYGGLQAHTNNALFEALTKGAGFLRTEHYQFPFSDRTLVGSFFVSVDDVLVDGNCMDPLWESADWVAIRHLDRAEAVEDHFELPRGSLLPYASVASNANVYNAGAQPNAKVMVEKDILEWYEIFSRGGFGNKFLGKKTPTIAPEFDAARGSVMVGGREQKDTFVYLCICPKCNYPLNLPSKAFIGDTADSGWVKAQTDWPTDFWRDNKWPVEMLSFYPHSGTSAWPEPPLAPALGELTCLNILMSSYVQQAFEGRQTVIAHKKGAIQNLEELRYSSESPLMVELDPAMGMAGVKNGIDEVLQFMKRPEINGDLLRSIEFCQQLVAKRTGLLDNLYGQNSGANPRSATEYQGKMDTVNIRPESMQKAVAAWQSAVADKEVLCAYVHVSGPHDIAEQLGPMGVAVWEELVTNEDPETILRSSNVVVEASGIRRPNKAKDMADLQGMQQYLLPILAGEAAQTGNPGPLNGFLKALGEAGEMDVSEFLLPEPPPDENAEQMKQAELAKTQAEADKLVADAEKSRADAQAVGMQGQVAQQDAAVKMQVAEHGMAIKQQTAEHAASLKERQAQMATATKQLELFNKQDDHEQSQAHREAEARSNLATKLMEAHQNLHQNAASHLQQTAIADEKARDDARRGNMISLQKQLNMAAESAARQKQASTNGATT